MGVSLRNPCRRVFARPGTPSLRFDDSLRTILSVDLASGFGAQSAWRQLVDLMGRGRIAADEPTLARLRMLRSTVPAEVRAASARALAWARPPAALVGLFAEDDLAIAAPVLRQVALPADDWLTLLGSLTPGGRSILRQRSDLPAAVTRGLESFGAVDFTLADQRPAEPAGRATPLPGASLSPTPFVALGDVARDPPVVAEARRRTEEPEPAFEIADIVARIDAFKRQHPAPAAAPGEPDGFRFITDVDGTIRWVDGVSRAALVGATLARAGEQGLIRVDAGAAAAVRRRSRFAGLRLEVGGSSDAAGSWRITGVPDFDPSSGRFTGFAGTARRPLRHESAAPPPRSGAAVSDSLRQLMHELRTPANAVVGFAELIEAQLLGPVPEVYRDRAASIGRHAGDLLTAIEDLDAAARIEGGALDLRPVPVSLPVLVERLVAELTPLAETRRAALALDVDPVEIQADERAVERVVSRLLATLIGAAGAGERIAVVARAAGDQATIAFDRPAALGDLSRDALFSLGDAGDEEDGAPLLGAGFTLRLVRNLAAELGGSLAVERDRLTLRLPIAFANGMGRASSS